MQKKKKKAHRKQKQKQHDIFECFKYFNVCARMTFDYSDRFEEICCLSQQLCDYF